MNQPLEADKNPIEKIPTPTPPPAFGLHDKAWSADQWEQLLRGLATSGMASWKEIASLVLGHLNPSQVGTSLASSKGFKKRYGKGKTMRVVMTWAYKQKGKCVDCGTRLELQADHVRAREEFRNPLEADYIENMTLRCRRCNVVKRPSHALGGLTHLTTESALMWILLVIKPRTLADYVRLCRLYGMTMADIRMQEAWAMAHWLATNQPPLYKVEDDDKGRYDLLSWSDGALTRTDPGSACPKGARVLDTKIPGTSVVGFLARCQEGKIKFYEYPVSLLPFSTYNLGAMPPQSLAIRYLAPDRKNKKPQQVIPLPPRKMDPLCIAVRKATQQFYLAGPDLKSEILLPAAPTHGRLTRLPANVQNLTLRV